jgi:hypothetical protein
MAQTPMAMDWLRGYSNQTWCCLLPQVGGRPPWPACQEGVGSTAYHGQGTTGSPGPFH